MPLFADTARFWQTVRHLRFIQLYGRLRFRLARPRPDLSPAPCVRAADVFTSPARRQPSLSGAREFRFLNQRGDLAEIGWDSPAIDKLWRYNQHYFDDLNARGANDRSAWHQNLVADWIAHNPPGQGTGWEPYPTSLRIVNWIKWALGGNDLPPAAVHSLAIQTRWLMRRLEWHLLGNHLFANAKALVFAGLFFEGEEARKWRDCGLAILARELPEQILADGGQFELSPMYHALAFEDLLDLVNVFRAYPHISSEQMKAVGLSCAQRVPAMHQWLKAMCHPDGEIAFFNDAAMGVAPSPQELTAYAESLDLRGDGQSPDHVVLPESGYARFRVGDAALIIDIGKVGPDYLPGHAHADTLSFELSIGRQRVFVNSGTSVYGFGPERLRQRGTAAHNSVMVDGRNSSDVWHGFRVGRRAYPIGARTAGGVEMAEAGAAHDGYSHLAGHPIHHRSWRLTAEGLVVEDRLSAPIYQARAYYHVHPDVRVKQSGIDHGVLVLPDGRELRWSAPGLAVAIEDSTWHPEFGLSLANQRIVAPLKDGRATFELLRT